MLGGRGVGRERKRGGEAYRRFGRERHGGGEFRSLSPVAPVYLSSDPSSLVRGRCWCGRLDSRRAPPDSPAANSAHEQGGRGASQVMTVGEVPEATRAGWMGRRDALGISTGLSRSALRSQKPNLDSVFVQPAATPAFLMAGAADGMAGDSRRATKMPLRRRGGEAFLSVRRCGCLACSWPLLDSNQRPLRCERSALPAELSGRSTEGGPNAMHSVGP